MNALARSSEDRRPRRDLPPPLATVHWTPGAQHERWDMPLDHAPLAVLDCETTGLVPGEHHIVTLAILHAELADPRSTEVLNIVVDPQRPVPALAAAIHGYSTERLARLAMAGMARPIAAHHFSINRALSRRVPVAHNLALDAGFLTEDRCLAVGPDAQRVLQGEARWWGICTRDLARVALPRESHKLDALCDRYNIPLQRERGLHDAADDARACLALLRALVSDLRDQGHILDTVADAILLPAIMLGGIAPTPPPQVRR